MMLTARARDSLTLAEWEPAALVVSRYIPPRLLMTLNYYRLVKRAYRLVSLKSTTPEELFARKVGYSRNTCFAFQFTINISSMRISFLVYGVVIKAWNGTMFSVCF